jgi:hypothetical protein
LLALASMPDRRLNLRYGGLIKVFYPEARAAGPEADVGDQAGLRPSN